MGKVVSASDFDPRFARLIDELAQDGEPVTIVRDGQVVATLTVPSVIDAPEPRRLVIGMLRSPDYRDDWDFEAPVIDPDDWKALRESSRQP